MRKQEQEEQRESEGHEGHHEPEKGESDERALAAIAGAPELLARLLGLHDVRKLEPLHGLFDDTQRFGAKATTLLERGVMLQAQFLAPRGNRLHARPERVALDERQAEGYDRGEGQQRGKHRRVEAEVEEDVEKSDVHDNRLNA